MNKEQELADTTSGTKGFAGFCVAAFEARFAQEMAKLIAHHGGEPLVAPAMAEVPLGQNVSAFEFAERLFRGELPVVVFLTGVGTRALFEVVETRYSRERLVEALGTRDGCCPRAETRVGTSKFRCAYQCDGSRAQYLARVAGDHG